MGMAHGYAVAFSLRPARGWAEAQSLGSNGHRAQWPMIMSGDPLGLSIWSATVI